MTKSEYRKNNLNGCFYDMKAQSKHFWNEIYRVRKNAMRLRVAKNLRFYRFWLSSDGSFGEGGCTKRLSLIGLQKPFATDAADGQVQTRADRRDRVAELRV